MPRPVEVESPVSRPEATTAGRAARPVRPERLAEARAIFQRPVRDTSCGPYRILTDLPEGDLLRACRTLADELDSLYRQRFGVNLVGQPEGAVFLYGRLAEFRAKAAADGRVAGGYGGFSAPLRGTVTVHADGRSDLETLRTLFHELAHLVARRAFGSGLPPWLSEGLAETVGDTATPGGFAPVGDLSGSRPMVRRLREAESLDRTRPFAELFALSRRQFDQGPMARDYEQSALLVRYLLLSPEHAGAFRRALARLSAGESWQASWFLDELGLSAEALDAEFRVWLRSLPD